MDSHPPIDPERFFDLLGARGKIRGVTGARLDRFGYGQFANGVKHTIAMWAPSATPAALSAGEVHPEQTIHVRILPDARQGHAYFMARVADERATHVECTSLAAMDGMAADEHFAYHSPRLRQYGFVARYRNYLFLYYISASSEAGSDTEESAKSKMRAFDNHVAKTLRSAL